MRAYGNSMIIGPWGEVISRAKTDRQQILFGKLDFRKLQERRLNLPSLKESTKVNL